MAVTVKKEQQVIMRRMTEKRLAVIWAGFIGGLVLCLIPQAVSAENLTIYTEEWPPVSFSENGKPAGLAVEVVEEILKRLQMPNTIRIVPWARGWHMITEKSNVVLFTMTRTPEREELFSMIGPVAVGTTNFYAVKGSRLKIGSLEAAGQVERVGVYRDSVEDQLLTKAGLDNLQRVPGPVNSAKQLMSGRIDLWCSANLTVGSVMKQAGYAVDQIETVFKIRENHLYIAFSKGSSETVIEKWLEALKASKADGTFSRMYRKWLPGETPPLSTERIGAVR